MPSKVKAAPGKFKIQNEKPPRFPRNLVPSAVFDYIDTKWPRRPTLMPR
jgi:hypothetical protein